jgi:hypothetical protein
MPQFKFALAPAPLEEQVLRTSPHHRQNYNTEEIHIT